jgi:hypothetical protein
LAMNLVDSRLWSSYSSISSTSSPPTTITCSIPFIVVRCSRCGMGYKSSELEIQSFEIKKLALKIGVGTL